MQLLSSRICLSVFLISLIFLLTTCIDPFTPKLDKYESLMVVDGLITDENASNYVRIYRTTQTPNELPEMIISAAVSISDDIGNQYYLEEVDAGVYKTDSLQFRGQVGRTYTLHITTPDGKVYLSDPSLMYEVSAIDDLYYTKDKVVTDTGDVHEGLRILIDSREKSGSNYYRWTYNEWWKFSIPTPKNYVYIDENNIYFIDAENITCWKNHKSDEIMVQSVATSGAGSQIIDKPILFIPSAESNRLLIQYYVEVSQLSISEKEYEFWRQLNETSQSGGDIFDKQPYTVISNLHSTNDPTERVLGYFQVSGVKRINRYITRDEIKSLELDLYKYDCNLTLIGPMDFPPFEVPITFDQIYLMYVGAGYTFISPSYNEFGALERLAFADRYCADCSLSGNPNRPDFWVDLQ